MQDVTMGPVETRFAELIWSREPISSTELWRESEKTFGWKKSTTFTVLKRLCEKGIFQNEKGTVSSLLSREDYQRLQSRRFVEEAFQGSLPAFLAAFTGGKPLSREEAAELRRLVADFEEG